MIHNYLIVSEQQGLETNCVTPESQQETIPAIFSSNTKPQFMNSEIVSGSCVVAI